MMLLIGAMIGSAIFSLSGLTLYTAGPAAVVSWIAAGGIMLFYGLFLGELSCRYPKSGGVYFFAKHVFRGKTGRWIGWLSAWSFILTNIVAVAFSAIYVGQYLSVAFPQAKDLQLPLALGSILFCLILNLIRIDLAGKINTLLVLALLATMLTYICTAFSGGTYSVALLHPFFTQGAGGTAGFLESIPIAVIGYSGIVSLAFMVADVRNARKTVPLSMTVSMVIVSVLYALMILATAGLVPASYLAEHPGMRFIPIFCACFEKLNHYPWLTTVVAVAAVLSLMTTMLVCISMNARAIKAVSDDGILPGFFGRLNSSGTPAAASVVTCGIAAAYSCFPEYTCQIVNFGAVFNTLTMIFMMLALIRSRRVGSDGIFTAPGGTSMPYVMLALLLFCDAGAVFSGGLMLWGYTGIFLLLGAGILLIAPRRKRKSRIRV